MSKGGPLKKIIIAGGGTAGWMTAAALGKTLGKALDITLIESAEIGTIGVGEATIPTLLTFNNLLRINEAEFMRAVNGTFKLGIAFENWKEVGHRYIHSFGITGKDHWTAGFQHFWRRGLKEGCAEDFGAYCLELMAAEKNKFAHLPDLGLNYAYHIDSALYAKFLRRMAETDGVTRIEDKIVEVGQNPETGDITGVTLASGRMIDGDLFIDCSGFRGLLIEKTLHTGYEDWTHWLPCDSAVAVQTASVRKPPPYTRSIAHGAGWQWRIPLQHRVGNGLVFCSRYLSDDDAIDLLMKNIEGDVLKDPFVLKFRTGMRRKHWNRNCIAIGLSGGFIEPLESTSIHLIQRAVIRLLQMFPHDGVNPYDVEEFNRQTIYEFERIRDFIILHYHVTERDDSPFWRLCKGMDIPASLRHRIDLFAASGRVYKAADELFAENSWTQVMLGQGVLPNDYHPVADIMSDEELARFLNHIRSNVDKTVAQLPEHWSYISTYCDAKDV